MKRLSLCIALALVGLIFFEATEASAPTMKKEAPLAALTLPAFSENWVRVHDNLWIDKESMFTDEDGYTRFKTRELDGKGTVMYQHKEAIHCGKSRHYFRKMYGATDPVNNGDDADVSWTDWRDNPREAYNIDRLCAIKNYVCGSSKK